MKDKIPPEANDLQTKLKFTVTLKRQYEKQMHWKGNRLMKTFKCRLWQKNKISNNKQQTTNFHRVETNSFRVCFIAVFTRAGKIQRRSRKIYNYIVFLTETKSFSTFCVAEE